MIRHNTVIKDSELNGLDNMITKNYSTHGGKEVISRKNLFRDLRITISLIVYDFVEWHPILHSSD